MASERWLSRSPRLTLGTLFRRFLADGRYLPDGSLKTEAYLRHCERTGKYLAQFFGPDCDPLDLTPQRLAEYVRSRRTGQINGRTVGTNCIKQEVMILKAAMNWACGVFEGGKPILARNPLEKYKVPREKNPKRPLIEEEVIDQLLHVADDVHPFLAVVVNLARHTGRRLSAQPSKRRFDPPRNAVGGRDTPARPILRPCPERPGCRGVRSRANCAPPRPPPSATPGVSSATGACSASSSADSTRWAASSWTSTARS